MTLLLLRFTLIGAAWALSYTSAFSPQYRPSARLISTTTTTTARSFSTRSSRLFVTSSVRATTANSTTATTFFDNVDHPPKIVDTKDFLETQDMEHRQHLEQLEKLVQQPLGVDVHIELTTPHPTENSVSTTSTTTKEEGFLSVIWRARLLLLGAAALYGTNFSVVKILGDTMPVGISASLRFGLAALATLPWLLQPPKDGSKLLLDFSKNEEQQPSKNMWERMQQVVSTSTVGAALAGFEVGMWNSVGYLAQAVGLETTDASKVIRML